MGLQTHRCINGAIQKYKITPTSLTGQVWQHTCQAPTCSLEQKSNNPFCVHSNSQRPFDPPTVYLYCGPWVSCRLACQISFASLQSHLNHMCRAQWNAKGSKHRCTMLPRRGAVGAGGRAGFWAAPEPVFCREREAVGGSVLFVAVDGAAGNSIREQRRMLRECMCVLDIASRSWVRIYC